jgi:hypothetical protein
MSTRIRYTRTQNDAGYKQSTRVFEGREATYVALVNDLTNSYQVVNVVSNVVIETGQNLKNKNEVRKSTKIALENLGVVFESETRNWGNANEQTVITNATEKTVTSATA